MKHTAWAACVLISPAITCLVPAHAADTTESKPPIVTLFAPTVQFEAPQGETKVGLSPWYTYGDYLGFVRSLPEPPHLKKTRLGASDGGREHWELAITDPNAPAQNKRTIFWHAREHAYETFSSYAMEGLVAYLLSDAAADARRRYQFVLHPMTNVDGVAQGHEYRSGYDYPQPRETATAKLTFDAVDRLRPHFAVAWHNWVAPRDVDCLFYTGSEDGKASRRAWDLFTQRFPSPRGVGHRWESETNPLAKNWFGRPSLSENNVHQYAMKRYGTRVWGWEMPWWGRNVDDARKAGADFGRAFTATLDIIEAGPASAVPEEPVVTVPRWQMHEFKLHGRSHVDNPFRDSGLVGEFTSPSGKTISVEGFHDGGDTWRLRFTPDEEGEWRYLLRGEGVELLARGRLRCMAAQGHGFIRVHPDNPYAFAYADGTPFFPMGDTCYGLYDDSPITPELRREYLETRRRQHFNFVRMSIGHSHSRAQADPAFWAWGGTPKQPDLDRFNPAFFRGFDDLLRQMQQCGMNAELLLLNFYRLPFTDTKLWTPARERQWLRYVVARYAPFSNVFLWTLANEYETHPDGSYRLDQPGDPQWARATARFVKRLDPYRHPVTIHPVISSSTKGATPGDRYDPPWRIGGFFGEGDDLDVLSQQTGQAGAGVVWDEPLQCWTGDDPDLVASLHADRRYRKPVLNTENGYEYLRGQPTEKKQVHHTDKVRHSAWRIVCAGGYFAAGFNGTIGHNDIWNRIDAPNRYTFAVKDEGAARQLTILYDFFASLPFWRMQPFEPVTGDAVSLAEPGKLYVIYLPHGGRVGIDLSAAPGPLSARWFDPRQGKSEAGFEVAGGGQAEFIAPDRSDWVLYLEHLDAGAADELSVDFSTVLNDTRHHPTGVNVDYLMDDDRNPLLSPQRSLREALRELGPRYLRYPGGWKSAINLWSVPPYTSSRPTLAGQVPEDWIRAGIRLTAPDGSWQTDPLDFDEFMDTCHAVDAEPCLVMAYESCHWQPMRDWKPPSREQLLGTAVAWVRYANKVKNYKVRYWEIGNESWLNNETWTNRIPAATYAADLIEFSRRMKAEDPAIQIGANGDTDAWWQAVLPQAAEHIDFLSVHTYPCWKWKSYEDYRRSSPDALGTVRTALDAIAAYAPAHKSRLKIMLTEFAAGTFGDWDNTPADLGRALITFDLQGQLLQCPQVYFSQFWNTHNIYSELDGGVFDVLMRDNSLSPIGRALWIWNRFLGDEMVATTSSERIRCFASRKHDQQLTLFLLNKDTSARRATVALQHWPREFTQGEQWVFHGNGPSDRAPTWARVGSIRVMDSRIALKLAPVSVTVIALKPEGNREDEVKPACSPREITSLDFDWRFHRGDIPATPPIEPAYDDLTWQKVDVPHDYIVEGSFDPKADTLHGSLPVEPGWYRKVIAIPASARGRRLWLEFDGVYRDSRMWLNGHLLGSHASGYTSFRYDITDVAKPRADNLLAVRVDPTAFEGWWYEGGGIYRHTRLVSVAPVHVAPWGVQVIASVPNPDAGVRADATVVIATTLANESSATVEVMLLNEILDADGAVAAKAQDRQTIPANGVVESKQSIELLRAKLWSCEQPYLYQLRSTITVDGKAVDQVTTTFGVRTFRFDAERGFLMNGKPVKIKGACNHQDFAGVGVALPDRVHEFRVQRLKEVGANAYRFSHHPMAPELLDACDRLGMLVMDENRNLGDSAEVLKQVENMVLRDRNHPCVVLWSLCNEEKEQGSALGAKQARVMIELIRRLDPTRPITAAMNGGYGAGLTDVIDVQGFNYHPQDYDWMHQKLRHKPMIATETAAAVGTRGVYARERVSKGNESFEGDPIRSHLAAYGVNAPGWAQTADVAWKAVAGRLWMAGGFVWTGFDYRGEPTPFGWPCIGSQFGIMDICGFPKDAFYYYQSWWSDRPVLHILPHWDWPGREGEKIDVWVYSNCPKVELFLNGASLGEQEMKPHSHLEWRVKYAPGKLVARGVYNGKIVSAQVETTGDPAALMLEPDRKAIAADGADVSLVTVRIVDDEGRTVPIASNEVVFTVTGVGRLLGVGNGDPSCHESDKGARRTAFNGLCLAILQASRTAGTITIKADSAGLRSATASIDTR